MRPIPHRVRHAQVVVDAMAGSSSIPLEATASFGSVYFLAGDIRSAAIRRTAQRRRGEGGRTNTWSGGVEGGGGSGGGEDGRCPTVCARGAFPASSSLEIARWDARCLPLRDGCLDKLVVDLPWGARHKTDHSLLPDALAEFARVLCPGGTATLLLPRPEAARLQRLQRQQAAGSRQQAVIRKQQAPPASLTGDGGGINGAGEGAHADDDGGVVAGPTGLSGAAALPVVSTLPIVVGGFPVMWLDSTRLDLS